MSLPGGRPRPSATGATGSGPGPSRAGFVGYALAAAAATSWGAQSIVAKLLLTSGLPAASLVSTRTALAGVGVVPLHTRGPDRIVAGVRANALPVDRLLLGVGSPNPGALGRGRAGIALLRAHLPARLVVAALRPRMCRLAGEVADGVLFNWLTPEHAPVSADWVRAGAAAAGRPTPRLVAYVRVAVGPAGAARLEEEGRRYAAIPAYADHFARMGVPPIATAVAAATDAGVPGALAPRERAVDDVVVRAITARDTSSTRRWR